MHRTVTSTIVYFYYKTPAGILRAHIKEGRIIEAVFIDKPINVQADQLKDPFPVIFSGTPFQIKVLKALMEIPNGSTTTYKELASKIGNSKAYRAVARALASNRIAYFIPCHRVIMTNGELGGYKWGKKRKEALLIAEQSLND